MATDDDGKFLKDFGGVGLVMTIIFTITFSLLIVILIKRQILRMLLISKRGPHTPVGSDAPQPLVREIEIRLRKIARYRIEPRMMSEQFNKVEEPYDSDFPPDQYSRGYKYRMKAMDKMTELDDLICSINNKYSRRKGQTVRGYLKMLQKNPYNVIKGGDDTIEKLADMYEHARFEPKEFGNVQYKKFAYLVEQVKDRVRLYINVPGSLIVNSSCKQPKKLPLSSTKIDSPDKDDDVGDENEKPTHTPVKEEDDDNIELQDLEDGQREYEGLETEDVNEPLLSPSPSAGKEPTTSDVELTGTVVMIHGGGIKETCSDNPGEIL